MAGRLAGAIISLTLFPGMAGAGDWVAEFYAASGEDQRRAVVDSLDLANYSFEDLHHLLANPPPKARDVPTGLLHDFTRDERHERFPFGLVVPDSYDASRAYPVVILLHGTVSRAKPKRTRKRRSIGEELLVEDVIQVFPAAWTEAKWWTPAQAANLDRIISKIKSVYNIDTDKIFLVGISDGATGGFYLSATHPGPYAGFVSVIGYPGVLKSSRVYLEENVYPINLRALKVLAFNTENDALYPADKMQYFVDSFREMGVDIEMVIDPLGGHDINALKRAIPAISSFVGMIRRTAHPDNITWLYEEGSKQHRFRWLIVHELLPRSERDPSLDGLQGMQPNERTRGMIELAREGNTVVVSNHGVADYSLLLSPDQFDFSKPVTLVENGVVIFQGPVEPNMKVLLDYATRDFDPRRLYGAEIRIAN
jgi:pimeloyl-ACP methyl ester carboxylesterase